jgi:hypothetical protein
VPKRDERPERRAVNMIHDMTTTPRFLDMQPTELHYEMVINGEVPEEDYDLLIDTIRRHWTAPGIGGMVGRTLTWTGTTRRQRRVEVSIQPKSGKTTLRVQESFKQVAGAIFGVAMGVFGGAFGAAMFGSMMAHHQPLGLAIGAWAFMSAIAFVGAAAGVQGFSERRQKALKKLVEELGAQARTSIDEAK